MKVMLHKNRGTHMKNHKVEKGCILAALLFVLLWIGGSFPVNAKETGRGRVLSSVPIPMHGRRFHSRLRESENHWGMM